MRIIIRKKRRTVSIKFTSAGTVEVYVPEKMNDLDIAVILEKHRAWIEKKQTEIQEIQKSYPQLAYDELFYQGEIWKAQIERSLGEYIRTDPGQKTLTSGLPLAELPYRTAWYKKEARKTLPAELEALAKQHRFAYNAVTVRTARRRWGSCTANKKISLNAKLILAPRYVREAIMLHELTHTVYMHHKSVFWDDLLKIAPQWHEAAMWLQKYGGWIEMAWDKELYSMGKTKCPPAVLA